MRGGRREGAGAKPKPPAELASVRVVANVTPAEAAEWRRRGMSKWLRSELCKLAEQQENQTSAHSALTQDEKLNGKY